MNYVEELKNGDIFKLEDSIFILTSDFKKDGSRLTYSLKNGNAKWVSASCIVEKIQVYTMDFSNTIIPIKEIPKENYESNSSIS